MSASTLKLALALLLGTTATLIAQDEESARPKRTKAPKLQVLKKKTKPPVGRQVDINSASLAELKQLKGVTEADAARIVQGRPYLTKANLITRQIISMTVYEPIKHQIFVDQHLKPAPTKK